MIKDGGGKETASSKKGKRAARSKGTGRGKLAGKMMSTYLEKRCCRQGPTEKRGRLRVRGKKCLTGRLLRLDGGA